MAKPRRHGVEQGLQGPMTISPNTESEAGEAALDRELKALIADVLGLDPAQAAAFDRESGLFGHLPELDSMAVAGLLTEMEDRLGIVIEDDDVDGEMLETYGGLLAFARAKLDPR
jgi:acyl carrier protein